MSGICRVLRCETGEIWTRQRSSGKSKAASDHALPTTVYSKSVNNAEGLGIEVSDEDDTLPVYAAEATLKTLRTTAALIRFGFSIPWLQSVWAF